MDGIFYKDGVYVHFNDHTIEVNTENDFCILRYHDKNKNLLYGGRVELENPNAGTILNVDGISVMTINNYLNTTHTLSYSEACFTLKRN